MKPRTSRHRAPQFEFKANSTEPNDKSGIAVWRYTVQRRGEDVEVIIQQLFASFSEAFEINALVHAARADGEAVGYAECERRVLAGLRDGKL